MKVLSAPIPFLKDTIMHYYQFILGCQQNYADGEKIAAILDSLGYEPSEDKAADLIVIIACSVRQKAVDRIWGMINNWRKQNPSRKYILCGCVIDNDKKKIQSDVDLILDSREIGQLPKYLKDLKMPYRQSGEISRKPVSEIGYVSIGVGCNNFCSYCAVPYARGREEYFAVDQIISETKDLVSKGCKEIMLLAQNVNSYKSEYIGKVYSFPDLLQEIDNIDGDFQISFLSPHPKDTSDELIEIIAKLKKVKKEIHLPLQSGDDEILKKMNRHYTGVQYLELVKKIRRKIPNVFLSTDIIVGFPTETEEQFQNTLKIVKAAKFDKAYVSQYSSRKGTVATKIYPDDVSKDEKKRRWKLLDDLINH